MWKEKIGAEFEKKKISWELPERILENQEITQKGQPNLG
jgi:hypothetical protein